jgi:hypothetical protein
MRQLNSRSGSTLLEFTLVGIPLVFILISIFEVSRGMWIYTTLAHAVKEGNRFAIVHGNNCTNFPNSCGKRISDIALVIRDAGAGLVPTDVVNLEFRSSTRQIPPNSATPLDLNTCIVSPGTAPCNDFWPGFGPGVTPKDVGANQFAHIEIRAQYRFRSAIALFWPGAGSGMVFPTFLLPASSRERIQY